MRTLVAIAALSCATVAMPSTVQAIDQTKQTRTWTHEWAKIAGTSFPQAGDALQGEVFLHDVGKVTSRMSGYLMNVATGAFLMDCRTSVGNALDAPLADHFDVNIVQVGPFAQQASGDVTGLLPWLNGNGIKGGCAIPPASLIISCPYRGAPIATAPDHITFNHSGTFRGWVAGHENVASTYSIRGHRDYVFCDVFINGIHVPMEGAIGRASEVLRGAIWPRFSPASIP